MITKMQFSGCFIASIVSLVFLSSLFQWNSEKSDRMKIPGKLISVGEHQFHLLCKGQGSPVVVLENGLWGSYPDWMYTLDSVSEKSKVCAYDRLGMGWSSRNNKPTRAADVAINLKLLFEEAKLDEPLILVGFSAGGLYVREYYKHFPENIIGMMLIDSSHEQQAVRMTHIPKNLLLEKFCNTIAWTGAGRVFGLFDEYVEKSFSIELHEEQLRAYNRTNFCEGLIFQSQGMQEDLFSSAVPNQMGDLPLVVIAAGKPLREQIPNGAVPDEFLVEHEKIWPKLQEELSGLSNNSTFIVAKNSGHAIQLEQPKIVNDNLKKMIYEYDLLT